MRKFYTIQLLTETVILLLLLLQEINGFCPTKCKCLINEVSCINSGLEVVPIQLNPSVVNLNLTQNNITNILFTLSFYTKLEILDLSRNKIESIGVKNFESQEHLKFLNLSRNSIKNLLPNAFKNLTNLTELDLSWNKIDTIDLTSMYDLINLKKLDLTNNNLISLDDGVLNKMISLEILIIRNNQLLDIPNDNLVFTRSLKSLDLSLNLIDAVRNSSFNSLRELTFLNLEGNVITELEQYSFDGLVSLNTLNLGDNNLTIIPTLQLSKLSNLISLSLSGNSFTIIPPVALLNLFHLRELHLDRLDKLIKIDTRAFVDNKNLEIITLDNNPSFSELPPRLFHSNPNLLEISIRANNLKRVDAGQFPLDHLKKLQLGNNPFECNCSLLWLWYLTNGHYHDDNEYNDNVNDNYNIGNKTDNVLILDVNEITCDYMEDTVTKKLLKFIPESNIKCTVHFVTIICAIISVLVVLLVGISVIIYIKIIKKRKKINNSDKMCNNTHERVIQLPIYKQDYERYQVAQALANDYRSLKPWQKTESRAYL